MSNDLDRYTTTYSNFSTDLSARIRREVYGEDIGQFSWTTASEMMEFGRKLELSASTQHLDVGCGSGGPALYLATQFGTRLTGVDINADGIGVATATAAAQGLADRSTFECVDAVKPLPFAAATFDSAAMIDAINHISDRAGLLHDLHRVLKPGGLLLYTDPVVITGPVTAAEIAGRSSIGFFLFMPAGENEKLLARCGFELLEMADLTAGIAHISERRRAAREKHRDELIAEEGSESYERSVAFSETVHALSSSRRLSRFMYLARRL